MNDSREVVDVVAPSSNSGPDICDAKVHSQQMSSTNTGMPKLHDFPDLTDFVNQRMEDYLNKLFVTRYTMANELYAEVANGFPDPVIVYPWNRRRKRNFDHIDNQLRPWREDNRRSVGSEWRSGWINSNYDRHATQESRKRRKLDVEHGRISYPGRTNP
uniref:Uncharacterized protein n=1 Tax=Setaria digitata TaxID=48799 RepID=A0A915PDM5_9BILA